MAIVEQQGLKHQLLHESLDNMETDNKSMQRVL